MKYYTMLLILFLAGCSSNASQTTKENNQEKLDDTRVVLYSNDGKEIRRWTNVLKAERSGASHNLVYIVKKAGESLLYQAEL